MYDLYQVESTQFWFCTSKQQIVLGCYLIALFSPFSLSAVNWKKNFFWVVLIKKSGKIWKKFWRQNFCPRSHRPWASLKKPKRPWFFFALLPRKYLTYVVFFGRIWRVFEIQSWNFLCKELWYQCKKEHLWHFLLGRTWRPEIADKLVPRNKWTL